MAFHPRTPAEATVDEQYSDVLVQVQEWADAEPNVERIEVLHVWRSPDSDRHSVEVNLAMREAPDQMALGLDVAS